MEQCVKLQLCLLGVGVRCTAKAENSKTRRVTSNKKGVSVSSEKRRGTGGALLQNSEVQKGT